MINGYFNWKKYKKFGNHDRKFGHNIVDYACQLPIVGALSSCFCYVVFGLIMIPVKIVMLSQIYMTKKGYYYEINKQKQARKMRELKQEML